MGHQARARWDFDIIMRRLWEAHVAAGGGIAGVDPGIGESCPGRSVSGGFSYGAARVLSAEDFDSSSVT